MKQEGVPAVFVVHEVAAVRAAIEEARDPAWTQLSPRFCNRLLIKGVGVRNDQARGIANRALK
jgi:hypothetical protein